MFPSHDHGIPSMVRVRRAAQSAAVHLVKLVEKFREQMASLVSERTYVADTVDGAVTHLLSRVQPPRRPLPTYTVHDAESPAFSEYIKETRARQLPAVRAMDTRSLSPLEEGQLLSWAKLMKEERWDGKELHAYKGESDGKMYAARSLRDTFTSLASVATRTGMDAKISTMILVLSQLPGFENSIFMGWLKEYYRIEKPAFIETIAMSGAPGEGKILFSEGCDTLCVARIVLLINAHYSLINGFVSTEGHEAFCDAVAYMFDSPYENGKKLKKALLPYAATWGCLSTVQWEWDNGNFVGKRAVNPRGVEVYEAYKQAYSNAEEWLSERGMASVAKFLNPKNFPNDIDEMRNVCMYEFIANHCGFGRLPMVMNVLYQPKGS